jgi:hypothetical protein
MRRLKSETRQPGMSSMRRCCICAGPLLTDGDVRCIDCRPALSDEARLVGNTRRRELEELTNVERQLENAETLLRKLYRRLTQ